MIDYKNYQKNYRYYKKKYEEFLLTQIEAQDRPETDMKIVRIELQLKNKEKENFNKNIDEEIELLKQQIKELGNK